MADDDRIERSELEEMFATIRETTDWPIDGDMLWGYFFSDTDRRRLEHAARELEGLGYRIVGIEGPSTDEDERERLYLHVERIETHTPETLDRRNSELYAFAKRAGLATYDGMDVGRVDWT